MADPRLRGPSRTLNEQLFDSMLRHEIGLRRFTQGEVKRLQALLEKSDREIMKLVRRRGRDLFNRMKLEALLVEIRDSRAEVLKLFRERVRAMLLELAAEEQVAQARILKALVPRPLQLAAVRTNALRRAAFNKRFKGQFLREWFGNMKTADRGRITRELWEGVGNGESVPAIARRLAGTRAQGFADGILAVSRREAETIVRTSINHTVNQTRELLWAENADIIPFLRWTSTLDGRTSAVCRARDGALAPLGGTPVPSGHEALDPAGARPPAHHNCRSIMNPILDPEDLAEGERAAMNGPVPIDVTYGQWLKRQPAAFQNDVLGQAKGRLFRSGEVKIQDFVDESGKEYTLNQLRATRPEAFEKAGLE
jgi:succinate dehydrogenase flavin-adding protein (antitoxin of CptAB toxin-antitoxin module)